jgi:hypothetical protein
MSLNAWLYAYANPVNMKDPSGYDSYCDGLYNDPENDCNFFPKPHPPIPDYPDPVQLDDWGGRAKKIKDLFYRYKWNPGWWC